MTSALKRARAALQYRRARSAGASSRRRPAPRGSGTLVQRFTQAYEAGDVHRVVALLTEDAWLIMPPVPLRYQGRELAARFWAATAFRPGRSARLVPTRANGQPAFGLYIRDPQAPVAHANGILVLTLAGGQISVVTGFPDNSALPLLRAAPDAARLNPPQPDMRRPAFRGGRRLNQARSGALRPIAGDPGRRCL